MATVVDGVESGQLERSVRLTQQVKAGGCASKLAAGVLSSVLSQLPRQSNDRVLVGFETADDAGVFRLSAEQAIVQTVDFFTPMVDDPFTYGRIAATNALSDVYAMGGRPLTALALVCFPAQGDMTVLTSILRGGLSVMIEAGCAVVGGHSVRDEEIKFGYAVTGVIDPERIMKNTGAKPGDALILTKALGTGVITTALKQGKANEAWVSAAVTSMTTSNRLASEIAVSLEYDVHAMTDVTGFGLLGHGRELAFGSGVALNLQLSAIEVLPGVVEAIQLGAVPAGTLANLEFAECIVTDRSEHMEENQKMILYDPQTAGGLLIALGASKADALVRALQGAGYSAARVVGSVVAGEPQIFLT